MCPTFADGKHLTEAAEKVEQALPEGRGIEEVVADKGYHSTQRMVDLDAVGLRSYVSEPRRGKRLLRQRGERLERPCAHLYGRRRDETAACTGT